MPHEGWVEQHSHLWQSVFDSFPEVEHDAADIFCCKGTLLTCVQQVYNLNEVKTNSIHCYPLAYRIAHCGKVSGWSSMIFTS